MSEINSIATSANTTTSTSDESNMFQEISNNPSFAKSKYIGEDYPYYKFIRTPSELGMSGKGTLSQLGKDIDGLTDYVKVLVSGNSKASATGKPLGNKFFLKTGGKCTANSTISGETSSATNETGTMSGETKEEDRYIYINNVPTGNIPFISSGAGVNFTEFKGLIPGTISNLNAFNPMEIYSAFMTGPKPECQEITMETIDTHNNQFTETHFVATTDIRNMDPCIFMDKRNPITGEKCRESFTSIRQNGTSASTSVNKKSSNKQNINLTQTYFAVLGLTCVYFLMSKGGVIP